MSKLRFLLFAILSVFAAQPLFAAFCFQSVTSPTLSPQALASPSADPDPHDEPSVAISQVNDKNIVAASNVIVGGQANPTGGISQVAYYFSSDGGATWGSGLLSLQTPQETFDYSCVPSVASDSQGNFYISAFLGKSSSSGSTDNGIYVFQSTSGGQSFGQGIPVFTTIGDTTPSVLFEPSLTVDVSPASPFKDTVYVAWMGNYTVAGLNEGAVRFSFLRPGATEFQPQQRVSHIGNFGGPSMAGGPNGELYVTYEGIGDPDHMYFNASTDGGVTFFNDIGTPQGVDFPFHQFGDPVNTSITGPGGAINIPGVIRASSFPTIDVDRSTGPNRGRVYIAWAEATPATNPTISDIFIVSMPPPNGAVPAEPVAFMVSPSGADQFFPSLSVDPSTGVISMVFYDQFGGNGSSVNTFLVLSSDGGQTFQKTQLNSVASSPSVQSSITGLDPGPNGGPIGIGGYIGLQSLCGQSHAVWTSTTNGISQQIFAGGVVYNTSVTCSTGPPPGPPNDNCATPHVITSMPFTDTLDTTKATSSQSDPALCAGNQGSNTVWYSLTPGANTTIGVDTSLSNYDSVVAVFSGTCGSLTSVACNDDFGNTIGNRSLLVFKASAGVTYTIEVAGKGSGGSLGLRVGFPTVTSVQYTTASGGAALQITGAGFVENNARATVQIAGVSTVLPGATFRGSPQGDGTETSFLATKNKLKKLIKPGVPVTLTVQSPKTSSNQSVPFTFMR
jgi:hypothetical protein